MTTFSYRAATADGRVVAGIEEVVSVAALERALAERRLYPIHVEPAEPCARWNRTDRWTSRQADLTEAIVTLTALLEAGLTIDAALEVASRGAARRDLVDALQASRQRVREGGRLADAMSAWPRLFPPIALALVRAGEQGGHLQEAMRRLGDHLERQRLLRARLLSALLYPLLLLATGATALVVLFLVVLPRFGTLLEDAGAELPASTALLLQTAALLHASWMAWALAIVVVVVVGILWRRSDRGRERSDEILLRIPWAGPLRVAAATARAARTVATLSAGGVPLVASLEITASAVGDTAVAARVRGVRDAVQRGESLSAALRAAGFFPYAFVRLVEAGEESGRLEALLTRSAALLEADVERRLERLVGLLEPVLILLFGVAVGFVALSLLQAIYGIHADVF